jgi:sulfatase modifying factor 1
MDRLTLSVVFVVAACGYARPTLTGNDGGLDSSIPDGTSIDAASSLAITVSPSMFVVHPNDTRLEQITVTNHTTQTSGVPSFQVSGLTLGTLSIAAGSCTTGLAPGASCTAGGRLVATTVGETGFEISVSAGASGTGSAALSVTVRAACAAICGPSGTTDCCKSSGVPGNAVGATSAGATFYRSYDTATDLMYPSTAAPATVSDFRLDTYEVTVGRFRAFVNAGMGTQGSAPTVGAGAHPTLASSGWLTSFTPNLALNKAALSNALFCGTHPNWTDPPAANSPNEGLPINCITWFEAMAFCAWDGGYLPTEAEWNYAASGGSEQRAYPWSTPASPLTIDCSYANYSSCVLTTNRVGSESPAGDSKWGQADLAGNVFEWALDWYASSYVTPCKDCANLTPAANRVFRGGSVGASALYERAATRESRVPTLRQDNVGVRCGRRL